MADERLLDGFDPYDMMDNEAARIEAHFATLDDVSSVAPSRCSGWSVRDVLAHLAATEFYFHACLDAKVAELFAAGADAGLNSLEDFNDFTVKAQLDHGLSVVLENWSRANQRTRRDLRARDGDKIDTAVGEYPLRLQAFHIAAEVAVHADDMYVPVPAEDHARRMAFLAAVSGFALTETKGDAVVERVGDGRTHVQIGEIDVELDDAVLQAAAAGRLPDDHPLEDHVRAALRVTP